MKRALLLAVALVAVNVGAATPSRARIINGQQVLLERRFAPKPVVEIANLQFYDGTKARTKAACTVVAGHLISRMPKQFFVITVSVDLYRISGTGVEKMGTATAEVLEPAPGERVKFTAIGPPCYFPESNGDDRRMAHHIRIEVKPHNPK